MISGISFFDSLFKELDSAHVHASPPVFWQSNQRPQNKLNRKDVYPTNKKQKHLQERGMGKMSLLLSGYSSALPPGSQFRLRIEKELFQLKQWCQIGMRPWRKW